MPDGNPPTLEYRPPPVARSPAPPLPALIAALAVGLGYACAVLLAMELVETDADTGRHAAVVQRYIAVVEFPLLTFLHPSSKDATAALVVLNGCVWSFSGGLAWRAWYRHAWRRRTP